MKNKYYVYLIYLNCLIKLAACDMSIQQRLLHPFKYRQRRHLLWAIRQHATSSEYTNNQRPSRFRKALIVSKLSRYEYEQHKHPKLNSVQLKSMLQDRGTDYELLIHYHRIHKEYTDKVAASFKEHGIDVKLVNR